MSVQNFSNAKTIAVITEFHESTKVIANIAEMLQQISEQIYQLDAQAALAGENGTGFDMISNEVIKLAEQSKAYTQNILELISGIPQDLISAISDGNATDSSDQEWMDTVESLNGHIASVLENVHLIDARIQDVAAKFSNRCARFSAHIV